METKIAIKNRFTGEIIFELKCNSIVECLLEAIKSSANLRYANLSSAETDKRYIQISCIGSAKRMTTYCFEDDRIWCGCFTGTLAEFEKSVNETHKDNAQWLKEYTGAINYIKSLK